MPPPPSRLTATSIASSLSGATVGTRMDGEHEHRHREAAARHEQSAARHAEMAFYWEARGDVELAELERRTERVDREAAQIERDRADLIERRRADGDERIRPC
jgi:hypothetical protein